MTLREHLQAQLVELWGGDLCDPNGAWRKRAIEENRAMLAILNEARKDYAYPVDAVVIADSEPVA